MWSEMILENVVSPLKAMVRFVYEVLAYNVLNPFNNILQIVYTGKMSDRFPIICKFWGHTVDIIEKMYVR